MDFSGVFAQMEVIVLVIMLGYIGARLGVMNEDTNTHLSKMVLNITLPCSILYSVFKNERLLNNVQTLLLTVVAFLTVAVMIGFAVILVRLMRIPHGLAGVTKYMLIFTNSAFLGFPVIRVILGTNAVFYAAVINMAFYLMCYTYGIILVSDDKEKAHFHFKDILTPIIIASLVSYVFYFLDIKMPSFVTNVLQAMDNVTSPLSLITIGCSLASVALKNVMKPWKVYLAVLIRMIIFPVAYYYMMSLFIDNKLILSVATIITAMPAPAGTAMLCASYGGEESVKVASATVFLSTLISVVSIPLLSYFLLNVS